MLSAAPLDPEVGTTDRAFHVAWGEVFSISLMDLFGTDTFYKIDTTFDTDVSFVDIPYDSVLITFNSTAQTGVAYNFSIAYYSSPNDIDPDLVVKITLTIDPNPIVVHDQTMSGTGAVLTADLSASGGEGPLVCRGHRYRQCRCGGLGTWRGHRPTQHGGDDRPFLGLRDRRQTDNWLHRHLANSDLRRTTTP